MDGRAVRRLRRRAARDERGAAALEFAIVVIPLLYLVFGIISYGYMLTFRQAMSQAAAEGARAAAVAPAAVTPEDRRTRAIEAINDSFASYDVSCEITADTGVGRLVHGSDPAGTCEVSGPVPCTGSSSDAQCVEVALDYTYSDDSMLPDVGYGYVMPDHLRYSTEVQVTQ